MLPLLRRLDTRINRNALFKLAAELIGRIASFALVLLAARQLGEAAFGLYNYGLALGFVVAQLADMGLQMVVAREVAQRGAGARPVVRAALRLKALFSLVVLLLLFLLTANYPPEVRLALWGLGLMLLAQTYLEFVAHVFRGQQRLQVEAGLLVAARLLLSLLGALVLWRGGGLAALALSGLLALLLVVALGLRLLYQGGWLAAGPAPAAAYGPLLAQALPLGIAIFLSIAYTRLAILMLQARAGELLVAEFSAASRLVEPAQILPASLLAAVFPAYALALRRDPQGAARLAQRVALLLAGAGLAVALGFLLLAPWLIPLLYGPTFAGSVPVLQVLGFAAVPAFLNYSLTHYLIARGRQAFLGFFNGAMLLLHAGLSWLLIPNLGAVGPALSTIAAELLLSICCLGALRLAAPSLDYVTPADTADADPAGAPAAL